MHYDIEEIFGAGANLQLQFSFLEWLHLCEQGKLPKFLLVLKQRKTMDKFVSESPDLRPSPAEFSQDISAASVHRVDKEHLPSKATSQKNKVIPLVTETLAKVYHQQKKYHLALEAYRQLRLEYPEKSSYFARLIKEIKAERV